MSKSSDAAPTATEVREQLSKILATKGFANSSQRTNLLRYIVDQTLKGAFLKEETIRKDVFPAYKPESTIVRVILSELRNKYLPKYREDFPEDPVSIDIPPVGPGEEYKALFTYVRNPRAMEQYRRGLNRMKTGNIKAFDDAGEYFWEALEIEPDYAPAHQADSEAMLLCALRYAIEAKEYPGPHEWHRFRPFISNVTGLINRATGGAERAIEYNPNLWKAHILRATTHACHFEWDQASAAFEKARALAPVETEHHPFYAACRLALGNAAEALDLIRRQLDLENRSSFEFALLRLFSYVAREGGGLHTGPPFSYEHWLAPIVWDLYVADVLNSRITSDGLYSLDLDSGAIKSAEVNQVWFHFNGMKHLGRARLKDSLMFFLFDLDLSWMNLEEYDSHPLLHELVEWTYPHPESLQIALAYMALAEIKRYRGIPIKWCVEPPPSPIRQGLHPEPLLQGCRGLRIRAIEALGEACLDHDPTMVWLHLWPSLDPLREEPEFAQLLDLMKLPKS